MTASLLRWILAAIATATAMLALLLALTLGWPWPKAIGTAIVIPPMLHAATIGIQFLLIGWWSRAARHAGTSTYPPVEPIDCGGALKAWLEEIPTAIMTFVVRQPWLTPRSLPSGSEPGRSAILLVHGYFCNHAVFRPMARWLAARGHPVGWVDLEPVFTGIDDYAPQIEAAFQALADSHPDRRLVVIGHSMGGLAIRAWLRARGRGKVRPDVITFGTPHHGTRFAHFSHAPNSRQMRPDSAWLRALAADERIAAERAAYAEHEPGAGCGMLARGYGRPRITIFVSVHDNIVWPAWPQGVPGATVIACSGLGHVAMLTSRRLRPALAAVLDGQSVTNPASGTLATHAP